eukprot:909458_1
MNASLREIAILVPLQPRLVVACVCPVLKQLAESESKRLNKPDKVTHDAPNGIPELFICDASHIFVDLHGSITLDDFQSDVTYLPLWPPPEHLEEPCTDPSALIWAFGVLCLELALGMPGNHRSSMEALEDFRSLAREELSAEFFQMLESCLETEPSRRPSAKDLLALKFFAPNDNSEMIRNELGSTISRIIIGQSPTPILSRQFLECGEPSSPSRQRRCASNPILKELSPRNKSAAANNYASAPSGGRGSRSHAPPRHSDVPHSAFSASKSDGVDSLEVPRGSQAPGSVILGRFTVEPASPERRFSDLLRGESALGDRSESFPKPKSGRFTIEHELCYHEEQCPSRESVKKNLNQQFEDLHFEMSVQSTSNKSTSPCSQSAQDTTATICCKSPPRPIDTEMGMISHPSTTIQGRFIVEEPIYSPAIRTLKSVSSSGSLNVDDAASVESTAVSHDVLSHIGLDFIHWSSAHVMKWLRSLGRDYEQYCEPFESSGVDGDLLSDITDAMLIELSVTKAVHRSKITKALNKLRHVNRLPHESCNFCSRGRS